MNLKKHKPNILNFTSKALAHFKHMVSKQGKENKIRLGVKKMGCNGFSYFFEFVNRPNKSDEKLDRKFDDLNRHIRDLDSQVSRIDGSLSRMNGKH